MFVNTGLIPLALNYDKNDWFVSSGLVPDVFSNVIAVSFVGPIIYFISPRHLYNKYIIWKQKKRGIKANLSQRQLNKLSEGPLIDMAQRYSTTMLLLMMSAFYTVLIPVIPIV